MQNAKAADLPIFSTAQLTQAAQFTKHQLLAYPSESVWGIGCDAFNEAALRQLVQLKNRDDAKGFIVLTDRIDRLAPLFANLTKDKQNQLLSIISSVNAEQMHADDQAVTWLVPVAMSANLPPLPKLLVGEFATLAVRITPHPQLASLCASLVSSDNPFGFLVSTSCNPSGEPPATSLKMAMDYFGDRVGYLAAEGLGFSRPSRIIDVLTGATLR